MEVEALNKILENHKKWLIDRSGERANLADTDLAYVNLAYVNLAHSNLENTNLAYACLDETNFIHAYLAYANLIHANLVDANLACANLMYINLMNANLVGANLKDANLMGANLRGANLYGVNLSGANLYGANLDGVNLSGANLEGANLMDANLIDANLEGAKNIPYIPLACPSDGAFVGWKRVGGKIVKLQILEDSKRVSATTRQCRCDKAYVMEIQDINGNKLNDIKISSNYDKNFVYRVGEIVEVKDFCEDRWRECSAGIHFFANRQDAVNYW